MSEVEETWRKLAAEQFMKSEVFSNVREWDGFTMK